MSFIEFKNITKAFGENKIYDRLNLQVEKGETITIIGGSGSGKTILLKILIGLVKQDGGEVYFDGKNISKLDEAGLHVIRGRMGMLFQGGALFDSLTVRENVAYPLREHFDYSEDKIVQIVAKKLELVGLPETADMMPNDLSGGMKKRVALARAIATDPEVILYDEPTTGLDPINTTRIDNLIRDIQKKMKVTSIVVTHDMASAFKISDRLAFLHHGNIETVGTVEEMKRSKSPVVQDFITGESHADE
jgi:phospholipid/cholesterol/gamma-HCH transport system ATP-binding protein